MIELVFAVTIPPFTKYCSDRERRNV